MEAIVIWKYLDWNWTGTGSGTGRCISIIIAATVDKYNNRFIKSRQLQGAICQIFLTPIRMQYSTLLWQSIDCFIEIKSTSSSTSVMMATDLADTKQLYCVM